MSSRRLQTLIALVLTGLWGAGVYFGHASGHLRFLDRIEATLTDLRTLARGISPPPDLVTIIAIDDATVKLGGRYPLARTDLAGIVDGIARLEPKVVAVDLLLVDRGSADGDAALAKALAARPTVLAAAALFPQASEVVSTSREGPLASLPQAERFLLPLPAFADHAEVGIVNVSTGQTGTPLSIPMLFRTGDKVELSFPLRVAALALGEPLTIEPNRLVFGDRRISTDSGHALPITYYGPRHTIRTISATSVIDGTLDPTVIHDRIVVLGATVTGGGDFFPTPFDSLMPGVEIASTAITHLVAGDGVVRHRSVRIVEAVTTIVLPMAIVGLLAWRRSAAGLVASAAVVLVWAAANAVAFRQGVWLNAATTIAAVVPPAVIFGAVQLWSGGRRAQYFAARTRMLGQFQAPAVQEWLARDPDFLVEPVRQNGAVVFIDLSGFTSLSERLEPDTIRELLKEFHALVDREAMGCGGMITGFLGDGAMILFGLPRPQPDDAVRAIKCSVGLTVTADQWIAALPPSIGDRIGFKVGAHFGTIVASRLGGRSHQHITATGDTVNVASRLMEVAARHGAKVALSDTLLGESGAGRAQLAGGSLTGPVETQIRGRSGTLAVWLWRNEPRTRHAEAQAGTAG
jgi:adenylate cyclase